RSQNEQTQRGGTTAVRESPQAEIGEVIDLDFVTPHGSLCATCGGPVEQHDQFCSACGAVSAATGQVEVEFLESTQLHFRCESCGAEVGTDPNHRSYVCPFCDSTFVVEFSPERTGRQRPEFVIGFAVTPEQALQTFQRWISSNAWFRPGDLKSAQIAEKLKGVYLPFWSFSMLAVSQWSASIGENWDRKETYTTTNSKGETETHTRTVTETEWWPLAGNHHQYYSGYLISGSRGLSQHEADRIKPFHLTALSRYQPSFLAGWLSEEYSVSREEALELCRREFYQWEQQNVAAFLPGDRHRQLSVSTRFHHEESDLCLLPVYVLSYRYQNKLYRFLVNGQTGKHVGDKPVSGRRIALAAGVCVFIVAAVFTAIMLMRATH
ncbi:MAG: zinc ribbon domain-containing protein, partial [Planctomycetaceae bacterium]|nr:zinc ribbon domain-containing protein [Planctomycetaceae bacterium]